MKPLTKSNEDYLEAILVLGREKEGVKSIRIAEFLNVSRPAVTKAMTELLENGLINKSSYSDITLTESGVAAAKNIYQKHVRIKEFLIKIGVSEETAEVDCCKLEHVVSTETIERLIDATNNLNKEKK